MCLISDHALKTVIIYSNSVKLVKTKSCMLIVQPIRDKKKHNFI